MIGIRDRSFPMTNSQVILLITGAARFLGSAITVDLARDHAMAALDCREPAADLRLDAAAWSLLPEILQLARRLMALAA